MPSLRTLTIVMAVAGVLAGLPTIDARACDNDRYPCPIVSQPQETAAAVRPSAQSRKKASRAARQDEKTRAKPAKQEQVAESGPQKAADPAPAVALNDEVDRNESPVAAAAAAWLVLPNTAGTSAQVAAADAAPANPANEVQVVDPKEVNELDLAAAPGLPDESSWLSYLVMTLGGALAAASAVRFLFV